MRRLLAKQGPNIHKGSSYNLLKPSQKLLKPKTWEMRGCRLFWVKVKKVRCGDNEVVAKIQGVNRLLGPVERS